MRLASVLVLAFICACSPPPAPTPSTTPSDPVVDCGALASGPCEEVAEAAELMAGAAAEAVEALPLPSDGGLAMTERYLVRLARDLLVEVVRFEGSDNWSVRRLDAVPSG